MKLFDETKSEQVYVSDQKSNANLIVFNAVCAVDTFQAALEMYEVRYPALISGKIKKIKKYCIAEYQNFAKNSGFKSRNVTLK